MKKNNIYKIVNDITFFSPPKNVFIIVYCIFLLLFVLVSAFHEPWLDEAQAWLISRDSSYYEMLFYHPHYEGHPPLWWLILSIPAKLGFPYEISMTVISLIIISLTGYIIIFKSPFCAVVRLSLPFSFFVFYQYGIVARPYLLLNLAFVLAACSYKKRNTNPFSLILPLMLMCFSSVYGVVTAAGIAVSWCVEILMTLKNRDDWFRFIKSRRFISLCLLLITGVMIFIDIFPADDVFVWSKETIKDCTADYILSGRIRSIIYFWLGIPADCTLSSTFVMIGSLLDYNNNASISELIILSILSLVIWITLINEAYKKNKMLILFIPYVLLFAVSVFVYFNHHHIGIFWSYFLFIFWICYDEKSVRISRIKIYLERMTGSVDITALKNIFIGCAVICGVLWTAVSSVNEIVYDYDYGRSIARYIRENNLDKYNIMTSWQSYTIDGEYCTNSNAIYMPVSIAPYFEKNIFFNLNNGDEHRSYAVHKQCDYKKDFSVWSETVPDVIIGEAALSYIYDKGKVTMSDYVRTKEFYCRRMWKMSYTDRYINVYVRKDIADNIHE